MFEKYILSYHQQNCVSNFNINLEIFLILVKKFYKLLTTYNLQEL